jgi:UDP-N-acetylglucosamine 2-epimerase (non-hydrolysing)
VIGTRPEAIKLKPVAHALVAYGTTPTLVITGQHAGLDPGDFGLDSFETIRLDCSGREDPHAHVRAVTIAILPLLARAPALVVVQGDTSSALGAALASFTAGIPVAHVEAGLRTHDPMLPWPEEEYRTAIDANAELLFAPTEVSAANLAAEKVPGEIHVTGNTGIDAVLEAASRLPPPNPRGGNLPRILVTCHRRESWRDGLRSIATAVTDLAGSDAEVEFVLHPNAYVAGVMRKLLANVPGITLIEPCGHDELLMRMRNANLVLSDSGGIQEEAPALGIPLLVLRDKTERPEGIAAGTSLLVGTSRDIIVTEARRLLRDPDALQAMRHQIFPFGDGHAGPRIAATIAEWIERRASERRLA